MSAQPEVKAKIKAQIKKRAVNPEQKKQRIEHILNAAQTRFEQSQFADIRLIDIAADVGITKAAFYRYFRNKEVLFLALYQQHFEHLIQDVGQALANKSPADALTSAIVSNPMFCKLSGILHTILEQNLTVEEATEFKVSLKQDVAAAITQLLPYTKLTSEELIERFFMMHHCIIGAWANCNPSAVVELAITQSPELAIFDLSFEHNIKQHIALLFAD